MTNHSHSKEITKELINFYGSYNKAFLSFTRHKNGVNTCSLFLYSPETQDTESNSIVGKGIFGELFLGEDVDPEVDNNLDIFIPLKE